VVAACGERDRRQAGAPPPPCLLLVGGLLSAYPRPPCSKRQVGRVGRRKRWPASEAPRQPMTGGPRCRGWKPTAKRQTEACVRGRGTLAQRRAGGFTAPHDKRGVDVDARGLHPCLHQLGKRRAQLVLHFLQSVVPCWSLLHAFSHSHPSAPTCRRRTGVGAFISTSLAYWPAA
jgi:hypothetical protein